MTISFTGERFVPGQGGARIAYEHLHRYLFARRWSAGKRVLDVAGGEGYGAALLARSAAHVWVVELDGASVRHAHQTYPSGNQTHVQADSTRLPFTGESMDLVVALELLEHITDQAGLVAELARVCRKDAVVLISTPNKAAYSDARNYSNPFHVREFYREEFIELLRGHFENVILLTQQVRSGSFIASFAENGSEIISEPAPDERRTPVEPMYFLALCGKAALPLPPPESFYVDVTDSLFEEFTQEIERLGRWGKDQGQQLAEKDRTLARVLDEVAERDRSIVRLQEAMGWEVSRRDRSIEQLQKEFAERSRWVVALQGDIAERDDRLRRTTELLEHTDAELKSVASHLGRIRHALPYRILCRFGILPK
jgi:ubiquinone/menaquinone biosynthesis C-methylase UbiE